MKLFILAHDNSKLVEMKQLYVNSIRKGEKKEIVAYGVFTNPTDDVQENAFGVYGTKKRACEVVAEISQYLIPEFTYRVNTPEYYPNGTLKRNDVREILPEQVVFNMPKE